MIAQTETMSPTRPRLTAEWAHRDVGLYLDRCQIDTPAQLVDATWRRVRTLRPQGIGKVVDFGAGDARFSVGGTYGSYVGYEVDRGRFPTQRLPEGARVEHACAFSAMIDDADLCIGNPPFVRNQDLPEGWRCQVAERLAERSGVQLSGLANAWQYFFLLSLLSTRESGLCALVIPYEWVSRPSVEALRSYIRSKRWAVEVHRLSDHSFETVLTTASITIVDKSRRDSTWQFFETGSDGASRPTSSTSGADDGHIAYSGHVPSGSGVPRAMRGLSPGIQKVFVLTEGERGRLGLKPGRDVVRCATTLRHLCPHHRDLDERTFDTVYRESGVRCWLINPAVAQRPGPLRAYLDSLDPASYATATCLEREIWWNFVMPAVPSALTATCFKGASPKAVLNSAGVIAVGGVAGIHGAERDWMAGFLDYLVRLDLRQRIVAHANRLLKLEIGQLNTLIAEYNAQLSNG